MRLSFLIVLITFALSSLGATIMFPILAPLFLGSADPMFQEQLPQHIRSILFGLFLAAFPLAQFLLSPVIGEYSDRLGRKRAFLITLFLEFLGYALSAFGIANHRLSVLFVGRFLTGLGAANLSVCMATMVDLSRDEGGRVLYFGYGSAVAGVMFILGPMIGGRLSLWGFAFPMWVGSLFAALNCLLVFFFFKETVSRRVGRKVDTLKAVHNVRSVVHNHLYVIFFLFLFAWNLIYQFLPALLVEEFQGGSVLIGDLSTGMGFIWLLGTLLISWLANVTHRTKWVCVVALLAFSLIVACVPYPDTLLPFVGVCATAVFFAGGVWPILMGTISRMAGSERQGKTLGVTQSIQSLAMMLAPLLGGFFLEAHNYVPFFIGSLAALISCIALFPLRKL